ncbi:MAG: phosphodiester glycosidase family protein [Gemmatimonadales bacterium]
MSTRTVAPGVTYRRAVVNRGPWRINVLEIDLRQPGLSIRGVKAKDSFVGRETVSSMFGRYGGPGTAVAAINADFFNIRTGESENNVVIEGDLSKGVTVSDSPYDRFNTLHSQFGIDWKNHPYIDRFGLTAKLVQRGRSANLDGINFWPPDSNTIVLYTKAAGDSSPVDTAGRHATVLPLQLVTQRGDTMVFRAAGSIQEGGRASLASGGLLAAGGARRNELRTIGRRPGALRVITGLKPGQRRLRTVVGGWPRIVHNGRSVAEYADIVEGTFPRFSAGRHPRSAVGISKDSATLYLVTVDGRRESDSGMSLVEMANAMLQLGAYDAMNFDGGGSTTMVVEGKVVNRPSDQAGERPVGSALLVVIDSARAGKR